MVGVDLSSFPNVQSQLSDRMLQEVAGMRVTSFDKSDEGDNTLAIHSLSLTAM